MSEYSGIMSSLDAGGFTEKHHNLDLALNDPNTNYGTTTVNAPTTASPKKDNTETANKVAGLFDGFFGNFNSPASEPYKPPVYGGLNTGDSPSAPSGLSTGAIVGIVGGGVLVLGLIIVLAIKSK